MGGAISYRFYRFLQILSLFCYYLLCFSLIFTAFYGYSPEITDDPWKAPRGARVQRESPAEIHEKTLKSAGSTKKIRENSGIIFL